MKARNLPNVLKHHQISENIGLMYNRASPNLADYFYTCCRMGNIIDDSSSVMNLSRFCNCLIERNQ
jgi:hypothetical protein